MLDATGKINLLRSHLETYGLRTMVETGLYQGVGSGVACADLLSGLWVVDIDRRNCELAAGQELAGVDYRVIRGDSGECLPFVLRHAQGPALFWLDAHYVVDYDSPDVIDRYPVPLLRELEAIREWLWGPASVVLIDDVRLFGSYGWPSRGQVLEAAGGWPAVVESDDVLRLLPWTR